MSIAEFQVVAGNPALAGAIADRHGDEAPVAAVRDWESLWKSGLSGSLMFSLSGPQEDPVAEQEAQNIVGRYLERPRRGSAVGTISDMVDLQRLLQLRSQVISAVEALMRTC